MSGRKRQPDPARLAAFRVLRMVSDEGAYAHLAIQDSLRQHPEQAALITELVAGTCRGQGSYDQIIAAAANRRLSSLQPAVVDALRLGTHQLLAMRIPTHAAVTETVTVAASAISERVAGVVNAILRRVAASDFDGWVTEIAGSEPSRERLALETCHPKWIVDAYAEVLPAAELRDALLANNVPPTPTLCLRPGLVTREELLAETGGEPTSYSPFGVQLFGNPELVPAVAAGRAGVQDEGSQLVCLAAARQAPTGSWLDLCAGPGGKTALLAGLVEQLTAAELQAHRAELVRNAVRAYPNPPRVVVADGTNPPWPPESFSAVLADVPCTGLGALRRRPDARWRKSPKDITALSQLQRQLLTQALSLTKPGGLVAYVTCSPHQAETIAVVRDVLAANPAVSRLAQDVLPEVPGSALGPGMAQLWPHRHGTDAMFIAILQVTRPE